jgi:O-antigen ligase
MLVAVAAALLAFPLVAPKTAQTYWQYMSTITSQGMQEGTGAQRKVIWSVAWDEFRASPIFGWGTSNFGIATQRVLAPNERLGSDETTAKMWGRAAHSAPMTIISEYGLIGAVIAALLVIDFFRVNSRLRAFSKSMPQGLNRDYYNNIALALHAVFLTYCVSSFFYEIIYTQLFWDVLVLNRVLYMTSVKAAVAHAVPAPGGKSLGEGRERRLAFKPSRAFFSAIK